MPYSFKQVTIYVFDIHPAVSLLRDPSRSYMKPEFSFLATPAEYEQAYLGRKTVKTASFTFEPLPVYEQEKSHFWKSYGAIRLKEGKPDVWGLQLPFADTRVKAGLSLEHKLPAVTIKVIPAVYLSTLGWSTQLKLQLKGEIKKTDLIDLVGWLSRGGEKPFAFKMGDEPTDKKEVFRFLNNKVLEEVYLKGTPPHPGMKIINQVIVSLDSYEGGVTSYPALPSGDKALMRSLLFGQPVDPVDLDTLDKTLPILKAYITPNGVNFALLNFEQGALLFLQREAQGAPNQSNEDKRKVACFAENCKNCLVTALLLWQFYSQTGTAVVDSDLGRVKAGLPAIIKALPENYTSLFCTNLFQQHKGLTAMVPQS